MHSGDSAGELGRCRRASRRVRRSRSSGRRVSGGTRKRGRPALGDIGWDPVRAWRFIRASKAYRDAWRRWAPPPGLLEPAPFEVRWQKDADLGALRWGLLAWANPDAALGPLSPFWARTAMGDGRVEPGGEPLARLSAAGKAGLAGLRVAGGLILKIERCGAAAQVRVPGAETFPSEGGLQLVRTVARIEDVWLDGPAPRPGRGRRTGKGSFCRRWRVRPRVGRTRRSRRRSGARSGSMRSTTPTTGCSRASSGGSRRRKCS